MAAPVRPPVAAAAEALRQVAPPPPAPATLQQAPGTWGCPVATSHQPLASEGPLLRPLPDTGPEAPQVSAGRTGASESKASDYRHLLASTGFGFPRLDRWCVWIEPASGNPAAALWEGRWRAAVELALNQWRTQLPIQLVEDPTAAQVRLWRRRPPLLTGPDGRRRASHGRATLSLRRVRRGEVIRLEPAVEVLLSPSQRQPAIAATALHELGHAFGLWGHSDDPADAMAAVPGAEPVLALSRRDRATLLWLYSQPTAFGQPVAP